MKKFTLLFTVLLVVSIVFGQSENSSKSEILFIKNAIDTKSVITAPWSTDFADNLIPTGWGNYDIDGDGYFWETTEINSGVYGLISESFRMDIYDALTPDNYLITAKVDISALTNPVMNWKVMAIDPTDFAEHYSIYISTTGNTVADFTEAAVFSETLTEGGVQLDRSISLAGYGDEIWIAFRNHDCTNQFFMAIPELAFQEGEPSPETVITAPWSTDFADNLIPTGWGNYDIDGDGYFWETTEINSGVYGLISESFRMDIYDALTPDNYLITAKVDISALTNPVMNWKVMAIDPTDFAEHYSIYISTTGNTVADFTEAAVFSETLTEGGVQLDRSISLAGYGDEIWIAFRNHDCTNQFFMAIPELAFQEGEPSPETVTFNVDMNNIETTVFDPLEDILTISGSFTDPTWQEPTLTDLTFSDVDTDGIYSLTLPLTTDGSYEYKYYVNAGWTGAEWEGNENRSFDFAGETLVLNDVFGDKPASIENASITKANAYPNPTSNIFTLDLEEQSHVTIFNIAGQEVYNNFINGQTAIDLSDVEAGIYLINIINDNYSTQTKIIKK